MNAEPFIQNRDILVRTILTDSRKLSDINHSIFFALKARRDFRPRIGKPRGGVQANLSKINAGRQSGLHPLAMYHIHINHRFASPSNNGAWQGIGLFVRR